MIKATIPAFSASLLLLVASWLNAADPLKRPAAGRRSAANRSSAASTGTGIVAPGARLERLFTRTVDLEGGLTEGAAVAPDGSIYFSDIRRGENHGVIHRFDPTSGTTTVFAEDSGKSNGLIFSSDGSLLACEGADHGGRRVSRWNVDTKERVTVTDNFQGGHFNSPNDLCLDAHGRIYFSDPRYLGHEARELDNQAVYRVDPDGSVHEATREVSKPNGLAISPDGNTLYVADHDNGTDLIDPAAPAPRLGNMKIYAFRVEPSDGSVHDRRTLLDFGDRAGCDGMTVDEKGNIYLTARDPSRPGVMVINPEGREVAFISTRSLHTNVQPGGLPSNVEFGLGEESHVLYVTVDTSLYRIPLLVDGYHRQYSAPR